MEQQFQLKDAGNLSLFEQNQMTSEERSWWMKRLHKKREEQEKERSKGGGHKTIGKPSA